MRMLLFPLAVAALLVGGLVAVLAGAKPASAAVLHQEAGVRVTETGAGDLIITGGGEGVPIALVAVADRDAIGLVIDGGVDDPVDLTVTVRRNIRLNLGGGDDLVAIQGVELPGSISLQAGSAGPDGDELVVTDSQVAGAVVIRFSGAGAVRTTASQFDQTLVVRGGNGDLAVCDGQCAGGPGSSFQRNVRVQAGRRGVLEFATSPDTSVAVRLTVIGGAERADLVLRGELGLNPVLRTLRGDDRWVIDGARWLGKLRGITSLGSDRVSLLSPRGDEPLLFNVNLGGGDDSIVIDPGFDPVSRANGTGGFDTACDGTGVLLGTFEVIDTVDCR
jgi:hypothetical protein